MSIKKLRAESLVSELLTDDQGAALLNLSTGHFQGLQRDPGFPAAVWLGPRCKRHVRTEILAWALTQRERVPA